ncbi:MAG: transcriptional regulator PpsR [Pseudomonadota bacterium]
MSTRESDFWNERYGPRIAPEHFADIVATAADLAILLSANGRVLSVMTNPLNSALGRMDHWEGRNIKDFLARDSEEKVFRHLAAVIEDQADRPVAIEVNHADGATWDFPIRYTVHQTGREGRILMLGRDLRPVAELQQRLVKAQMALERDYETQRVIETRFRVVMEASRDGLALVDVAGGRILDANRAAARLLGAGDQPLTGVAFTQEFEGRRRAEFIESLCSLAAQGDGSGILVETRRADTVRIVPQVFRNAGERVLLCRILPGDDIAADSETSGLLADLYQKMPDAVAFLDAEGRLTDVNEAFLSLADADGLNSVRGKDFSTFLGRGVVDLKTMADQSRPGIYATRFVSTYGVRVPIEIAATALKTGGHAFVIRDTSGHEAIRDGATSGEPSAEVASGMTELVGSMPLRDIVASMTDVIEKQCIARAVELTNNNRVAAAEMLGLSRQSLYVKLRKYGLLSRDED